MTNEIIKLKPGEIIPLNDNDMFIQIFNNEDNICVLEEFISFYLNLALNKVRGNLEIQNRDLYKDTLEESGKEVDLLLKYNEKYINIEISTGWGPGIVDRNIVYLSNIHGRQLKKGFKKYDEIEETIQINLNAFACENEIKTIYFLSNIKTRKILSKKLRFDVIDMELGKDMCYTGDEELDTLIRWCKVFMSKTKEEFEKNLEGILSNKSKNKLVSNVSRLSGDSEMVKKYVGKSKWELDREATLEWFEERKEYYNNLGKEYIEKFEDLDNKSQELDKKSQELDNKSQELDNKSQELDNMQKNIDSKLSQAKEDGINFRNIEIAKNMLNSNISTEDIIDITGLTKEEIEKLK